MFDFARFGALPALTEGGRVTTYAELDAAADQVATAVLGAPAVAFLTRPGFDYVAIQHGIWRAGAIAVPLAVSHPAREIEYILDDAKIGLLITTPEFADRLRPLAEAREIAFSALGRQLPPQAEGRAPNAEHRDRPVLMVYTSGTTGRPKGVITTESGLTAQVATLARAWEWTSSDRSLHVLPLHHIHGIINALSCALWVGACVEFLDPGDPARTWDRLASGEITFFTAVPTIYHRLIAAWDAADPATQARWSTGARGLRLMLSGSAALPIGVLTRWETLTGHRLLERYGMTEIGMALANPIRGERRPGTVGQPLPDVEVRLVNEQGSVVADGHPGQIEIRGPQVFREYWGRPEETARSFKDGWFATGDVAVVEDGYYRILGRESVDIIKSAGYKISALEIEELAREHPLVTDCAVVAIPDPDLGERIGAVVVLSAGAQTTPDQLRAWLKERLAAYKVPKEIRLVAELPRNAMGKVIKQDLRPHFGFAGAPTIPPRPSPPSQ